jgi:hypothetical protein
MTILNIALPSLAALAALLLVARPIPQPRAMRVRVRKR